jgi:hypothetical protein
VHPVIAAFLDVKTALDVLTRADKGHELAPDEQRFAAAAKAHPELTRVVKSATRGRPTEDAQHAVILLGVRAALSSIDADGGLGPSERSARAALSEAGATADQIEQLLGGVLVEEAFTGDQDPAHFDSAFVKESFDGLPKLAALDGDKVGELVDSFVEGAAVAQRPLYLRCAEALFQSAWGEGPQSVNVEHVDEALEHLVQDPTELEGARGAMTALLRTLSEKQLIGALRLSRLLAHLVAWEPVEEDAGADEEDDEDEDDDDDGPPPNAN